MDKLEKLKKIYGNVLWTGKPHNFLGLSINFTRYIITDKKLIVRQGFLNLKEEKIELYKILDISMNMPISQRIFGCGTLILRCKDASAPSIELKQIKNPYIINNLLEDKIEEQKKNYGVLGRDIIGASINAHTDITDLNNNGIPDDMEDNDEEN